nr:uncharacterized protein LOC102598527 [Ipomoea batatas]
MEQGSVSRMHISSSNDQRLLAIGLGLLAVMSPLYIDRRRSTEPDPDEETVSVVSSYLPLLILITIMAVGIARGLNRFSSYRRVVAIGVTVVAVVSPLYIDREEAVYEEQTANVFSVVQPFLLLALIIAIAMSGYFDRSFTRFDPYWIHRVGGSSTGILILLLVLALVLKFKV